MFKAAHDITSL